MAYTENVQARTYIAGPTVVKFVGNPGMPGSIEPNVGNQYMFVQLDPANPDQVKLADSGSADLVAGVALTKAQHAETGVTVAYRGRVPVQAGEALAYGDPVTIGTGATAGQAVVGTVGVDTIYGTVVQPASAAGVLATIDLELGA